MTAIMLPAGRSKSDARRSRRLASPLRRALPLWLGLALLGCGTDFSPQSEVTTLRVLAVHKDKPYAKPGDEVELAMLWHDGSEQAPRPVQRGWAAFCFNPPGDLFGACFQSVPGTGVTTEVGSSAANDRFSFRMPDDIITSASRQQTGHEPYGLAYVLFAVCAGELGFQAPTQENPFPLSCKDAAGRALGSADFVAGYSAVYAYEKFSNANPEVTGFTFNGKKVEPDCVGIDCLTVLSDEPDCGDDPDLCIPSCEDDAEDTCPGYDFGPNVDPKSVELDETTGAVADGALYEQMWVTYHVDRGSVDSEVKLVNDALRGFNADHQTTLRAPREKGPLALWGVVRDNRGGVTWARLTLSVR